MFLLEIMKAYKNVFGFGLGQQKADMEINPYRLL